MSVNLKTNPGAPPVGGQGIQFSDGTALTSAVNGPGSSGTWNISITGTSGDGFPSGSVIPFYGASAPPLWTKVTTQSDKMYRVTSGAGGVAGGSATFSSVFVNSSSTLSGSTSSTTLAESQIPNHNHNFTDAQHNHPVSGAPHTHTPNDPTHNHGVTDSGHTHNWDEASHSHHYLRPYFPAGAIRGDPGGNQHNGTVGGETSGIDRPLGLGTNGSPANMSARTNTVGPISVGNADANFGNLNPNGTGIRVSALPAGGHSHTFSFTVNRNFAIQFVDFILCQKN